MGVSRDPSIDAVAPEASSSQPSALVFDRLTALVAGARSSEELLRLDRLVDGA
jgi:hypothetical protein